MKISQQFEEPDRVPITFSIGGSFFANLFGYNIRDYYTNRDLALEVNIRGLKWCFEEAQYDKVSYFTYLV